MGAAELIIDVENPTQIVGTLIEPACPVVHAQRRLESVIFLFDIFKSHPLLFVLSQIYEFSPIF